MVHYNLDIVLSVGNRIRSENTRPFQRWCKRILADRRQPFDDTKPNIIRFNEGNVSLDVRVDPEEDTVYLTQSQIAFLFDTTIPNVSMHIRNIVAEGELTLGQTVKDFLIVQTEVSDPYGNPFALFPSPLGIGKVGGIIEWTTIKAESG